MCALPAMISGVLLGISFPLVLRISQPTYLAYTGLTEERYLGHWLLITGILFGGSAIIYAIRLRRSVRLRRHSARTSAISASGNPPTVGYWLAAGRDDVRAALINLQR